jgi:hypothetical protein
VFISYAHDSDAHREQVRDLWVFLCAHGVDARIDRVAAEQREDWTLRMEKQVAEADRILIVASPAYKARAGYEADPEVGRGVQYEARLIRNLFYRDQSDLGRFLPVVLPGGSIDDIPAFLTPHIATVYRVGEFTIAGAEELLGVIHHRPGEVQPVIGPVPDLPIRDHTLAQPTASPAVTGESRAPSRALVLRHQVKVTLALDVHLLSRSWCLSTPFRATTVVGDYSPPRRPRWSARLPHCTPPRTGSATAMRTEDVPRSVELGRRPGDHQAAATLSL